MKETYRPILKSKEAGTTGEFLLVEHNNKVTSVLKTAFAGEEYEGHSLIEPYLNTLATRLIKHEDNDAILMPFVPSETLNDLVNNNDPRAKEVFSTIFSDMDTMWQETATSFDRAALKRDYASVSIGTLEKISYHASERLGVKEDDVLCLEGVTGGITIRDTLHIIQECLKLEPENMVIAHGDENFGNFLVPEDDNQGEYRVIDARFAGYHDKAWVLANIYARMHLFNANFPDEINRHQTDDGKVHFTDFGSQQPSEAGMIKETLREYVESEKENDPTLALRMAAYAAHNTARSVAYLRDASFKNINDRLGRQHFLQGIVDFYDIVVW